MIEVRRVQVTPRGMALGAVGAGIALAGVLLGVQVLTQAGLLLVGVLGYGLGVLGAQARSANRGGLHLVRRVTPHPVSVGDDALVEVDLTSGSGLHRLDRLEVAEQAARELSGSAGLRARVHRTRAACASPTPSAQRTAAGGRSDRYRCSGPTCSGSPGGTGRSARR